MTLKSIMMKINTIVAVAAVCAVALSSCGKNTVDEPQPGSIAYKLIHNEI